MVKAYRASGACPPTALLVMPVVLLLASLLGLLYGALMAWIPFIYLNFIIIAGFGLLLGTMSGHALKKAHTRNGTVGTLCGLVTGVAAMFFGWIGWLMVTLSLTTPEAMTLALSPQDFVSTLGELANTGVWSVFGITPNGLFLKALWGIEALGVVGLTTVLSHFEILTPYCENCQKWLTPDHQSQALLSLSEQEKAALESSLEAQDYALFMGRERADALSPTWLTLHLTQCQSCRRMALLDIEEVVRETDDKGEEKLRQSKLYEHLLIAPEVYAQLKDVGTSGQVETEA